MGAEQQNQKMGVKLHDVSLLKKVYASKLAVLSSQQTQWAKDVARMTGNCDYETVYKCNNNNKNEQQGVPQTQTQKRKRTNPSSEKRTTLTPQTTAITTIHSNKSFPIKKQRMEYTKMVVHPAMMNTIPFVPPVNVQSVQ